jgi:hypothetical protein
MEQLCMIFGKLWIIDHINSNSYCVWTSEYPNYSWRLWFIVAAVVFVIWEIVMRALHGSGEKTPVTESYALAKAEPAMDIEYIDDEIRIKRGDVVVVQNSQHRKEATAKEDTRIGVKRRWRGW